MATVKGDVHDIGKNIVGIVLGCNNYRVIDLGVMVPCEKILQTARENKADMIGLSGLITPSLDEMVHVAREMQRLGMDVPLLIGGATTSPKHTAVKIAPAYGHEVVHVKDASRCAPVCERLLSAEKRPQFDAENRAFQAQMVAAYQRKQEAEAGLLSRGGRGPLPDRLGGAGDPRALVPGRADAARLSAGGAGAVYRLGPVLRGLGDARQVPGDPRPSRSAAPRPAKLYDDARRFLDRIIENRWLRASGVYAFWPAASAGDDIILYEDDDPQRGAGPVALLAAAVAERVAASAITRNADFVAPADSGRKDYMGGFAVTGGIGADELVRRFEADHDDYSAIMAKVFADRLAEAFAERLHEIARQRVGLRARREPLGRRHAGGKVSRHSPGAGLSVAARPYGEADPLRPAGGRAVCGHRAHREFHDAAGRFGERILLFASRLALLRHRPRHPRPGRRLRPPQGLETQRGREMAGPGAGVRRGLRVS